MIKLSPLTIKQIIRFKSIKRGYYSLIIFLILTFFSFFAELFINSKALVVYYDNKLYFPIYSKMYPGYVFGDSYDYETNYKELKKKFENEKSKNWVILPLIPYNPFENDLRNNIYPPTQPSLTEKHILGTDKSGRDIFARLVYGYRIAISFSLLLLVINYFVGIILGCTMGYYGGIFDITFQRIIEIWSNIPFLYVVIIISSIIIPNFFILIFIMVFFGWMDLTWVLRTVTYKEKAREYILAVKAMGANNFRIIIKHIIPNTISIIITFMPFSISAGIISLTSLDYLGFGLRPPTPSWGELLNQGWSNLSDFWIAGSVISAMILILLLVTFIGEALREAFDPKKYTTYE